MTIQKKRADIALTIALTGRLDMTTAPELEAELQSALVGVEALTFNLAKLEYISSAGLRVLLSAQKAMTKAGGEMTVTNVGETVREVFEVTGFVDLLNIV